MLETVLWWYNWLPSIFYSSTGFAFLLAVYCCYPRTRSRDTIITYNNNNNVDKHTPQSEVVIDKVGSKCAFASTTMILVGMMVGCYVGWIWIDTHRPICMKLEQEQYDEAYDMWHDFCNAKKATHARATSPKCIDAKTILDYTSPDLKHNISSCTFYQILDHLDLRPTSWKTSASGAGGGGGVDSYIWITLTQTLSSLLIYVIWIGIVLAVAILVAVCKNPIHWGWRQTTNTSQPHHQPLALAYLKEPSSSSPPPQQLPCTMYIAEPVSGDDDYNTKKKKKRMEQIELTDTNLEWAHAEMRLRTQPNSPYRNAFHSP